jgi:hypothetical protein
MTVPLEIETVARAPVALVRVCGRMLRSDLPAVMAALVAAVESAPGRVAVCDVSRLCPPPSGVLMTVFPAALRRCGGWPRSSLHLAGADPGLAEAIRSTLLDRFLPVHADLRTALGAARADQSDSVQLTLAPTSESLGLLRGAVRAVWPDWTTPGRDDAELVASELAANAIRHVARPFSVSLGLRARRALIAVTDDSREEPVVRPSRPWTTDGRGLHLVAGLSQAWGVRLVHADGKTVWATLGEPALLSDGASAPGSGDPRSA